MQLKMPNQFFIHYYSRAGRGVYYRNKFYVRDIILVFVYTKIIKLRTQII